jgi:hypothetical protein
MSSRWLLSFAALLILAPSVADAAILIDARRQGDDLRVVIDAERQRALIATPRGQSIVDLARDRIYLRQGAGAGRQIPIERGAASLGAYAVTPWGPGPVTAGHATVYHVITYRDEICAEMLVSGWMQPFIAPVVQALDLLDGMPAPTQGGGCGRIPFAVYGAAGWPMLAGKIDHLTIETKVVRFDYTPRAGELSTRHDGWLTEIREAIWPSE